MERHPSMTWRCCSGLPCGRQGLGLCNLHIPLREFLEMDREGVGRLDITISWIPADPGLGQVTSSAKTAAGVP